MPEKSKQPKRSESGHGVGGLLFGVGILSVRALHISGLLNVVHGVSEGLAWERSRHCGVKLREVVSHKMGLDYGLIAAGLGMGAVVFAPIEHADRQLWVWSAFTFWAVYLIAIVGSASIIARPPAGYQPAGWKPPVGGNQCQCRRSRSKLDKDWKQMMARSDVLFLWVMYALGATSGLMIIGHAAGIGQESVGFLHHGRSGSMHSGTGEYQRAAFLGRGRR
jgi:OFA family oxalate/formate antiporter-like MFS transporter